MFISNTLLNNLSNYCKNQTVGIVLVNAFEGVVADMTDTSDSVSWDETQVGKLQLAGDMVYSVSSGATVSGWRAVNSSDAKLFGGNLSTPITFDSPGDFTLTSQGTYFIIVPSV